MSDYVGNPRPEKEGYTVLFKTDETETGWEHSRICQVASPKCSQGLSKQVCIFVPRNKLNTYFGF